MRKGLGVVALVVAYAIVGLVLRGWSWAPPPLVSPDEIVALAAPFRSSDPEPIAAGSITVPSVSVQTPALRADRAGSWEGFLDALRALELGRRQHVRVVHLGDSEIVADGPTRAIRKLMTERFGDGGLGFGLVASPIRWYALDRWAHHPPSGMVAYAHPHRKLASGAYGPGGVAFEASAGAHATVELRHDHNLPCTIRLSFGRRSGGGVVEVLADGKLLLSTSTEGVGLGIAEAEQSPCPRRLELSTKKGPTRLYGYEVRYRRRGITWSTLGVIGAELSHLEHYAEGALEEGLAALEPDLVVLGFGLNRAAWPHAPAESYREQLARVLERIRRGAPGAACLVIGPYPSGKVQEDGTVARVGEAVSQSQAWAAAKAGCAFLDRFALSGGPTAAVRWASGRPRILSGDYQHMTEVGAERMGRAIAGVILSQYAGATPGEAPLSLDDR